MPFRDISVARGLVTSRDPSVLEDGELVKATDCFYKPNDPAIHKVRGRTAFNAIPFGNLVAEDPETNPVAGAYLEFDGDTYDQIVIAVDNAYRIAVANLQGIFFDLETGIIGSETLDAVHYNNEHFILNGVDRNRYLSSTTASGGTTVSPSFNTFYLHGMLANTAAPTLAETGGTGSFELASGSTITYWFEERVKQGDVIVRRNAVTLNQTVTLTGDGVTTYAPILTHLYVNSDVTHLALFATATNGTFPVGAEIQELDVSTVTTLPLDISLNPGSGLSDTRNTDNPPIPTGDAYETHTSTLFEVTQSIARWGPPPLATTGCVFENSLMLNDVTDPRAVFYSWPNLVQAFPSRNRIAFETGEHDQVRLLRRMGLFVMVAMKDSLWRINVLPRPSDSVFDPSRVKEQVEGAFGIVGQKAGTVFSTIRGLRFAYVSPEGIVVTDGVNFDVLTHDIDWDDIDKDTLSDAVLRDNPAMFRLEFYSPSGNYYLHYHPSLLKGDELRPSVTGPITGNVKHAFKASVENRRWIYTVNKNEGVIYVEDNGLRDESDAGGFSWDVKTKEYFLNNRTNEAEVLTMFVHHSAEPDREAVPVLVARAEGVDDEEQEADPIPLDRRELTQAGVNASGGSHQFGLKNDDDLGTVSLNYFTILWKSQGETNDG